MEHKQRLRELEESLLKAAVRGQPALVRAFLAEEFREFGASGKVYARDQILEALRTEEPATLSLSEFAAAPLSSTIYLVTYRSRREANDGSVREALRSSIWRLDEDEWRMIFHQGTPCTEQARGR